MPDQLQEYRRHEITNEITCLAFQKVDYGVVNALLPTNQFIPIDWEDRPTNAAYPPDDETANPLRIQNLHRMIPLGHGLQGFPAVPQHWHDFTNIMTAAKEAILARMKKRVPQPRKGPATFPAQPINPGNVQYVTCETLHEATQYGKWNTPHNSAISKAKQVIEDISGQFANVDPTIHKWIKGVCDDFTSIGPTALESLLDFLFPNISATTTPGTVQSVVPAPSNTSINAGINVSITGGCAHSLVYGYHVEQRQRGRARERPVEYRVALSSRSGSGSRSPVRETACYGNLYQDMESIHGNAPDCDSTVIDSPGEYIVARGSHHHYFESHRPDLMVVQTKLVQNLDPDPEQMREEAQVKLVCELSTTRQFGTSDLTRNVVKNTEQCVKSCLSSLGYNQDALLGLVVVVDGFKLIKIERKLKQGNFSYDVSESDLIVWNNVDGIHEMFHIISNIM